MKHIPLSQGYFAIVDDEDFDTILNKLQDKTLLEDDPYGGS